jgi:hypothetical protein
MKSQPVVAQLTAQKAADQAHAREALLKIFSSVRYLARQGLSLRGHTESDGNLQQLLQLRSEDTSVLKSWMSRVTAYVSPESQNEILLLFSHQIQRQIAANVNEQSKQFGIIVDGTQDISGYEQESVCVRYVDNNLQVIEVFVGLFNPPDTTGQALADVIKDVMLRLNLPANNLRAQTYDGAANMAGKMNGCQAIISREFPLALHFHCAAHCANLAAKFTANSTALVRDALSDIRELGVLYKRSGKYKHIFDDACDVYETQRTLKPLCPTRWLCRAKSLNAVLDQYDAVLTSLEDMSSTTSETGTKAAGLLQHFGKSTTILGLKICKVIFEPMEQFNRSLQSSSGTLSNMMQALEVIKGLLLGMRTDEYFQQLLDEVASMVEQSDIEPVTVPRQRRPPARYTGSAEAHCTTSVVDYYRPIFFFSC